MPHDLGLKPGHLIWRAYQLTWQLFAEEAEDLDITPVQEALLLVLSKRSNVDQKTLAEILALDRSTAGAVLERLEKRGLVTRVASEADRRSRLVNLTKAGYSLSHKLGPVASRAKERLLSQLSLPERDELMRLLRIVVGLADPHERVATAPPLASKHSGRQILCIGLSGVLGETLVQRLRSEGAEIETIAPFEEWGAGASFDSELKRLKNRLSGVECVINGGNLMPVARPSQSYDPFLDMQSMVHSRWYAMKHLLPHLVSRGRGVVINIGVFSGLDNVASDQGAVATANAAIIALSNHMADEYRARGIASNSVSPRGQSGAGVGLGPAKVAAIDVAQAVSYLASDEARSVSASNILLG